MWRASAFRFRPRVGVLLLLIAALIWWGLNRLEPQANWLRVEGPRRVIPDKAFLLRVNVAQLTTSTRLVADLHWGVSRDAAKKYLSTGGSKPVGKEGGTFDFEIVVPPHDEVRLVCGVIFLSPTGNWEDHTLVAVTDAISVGAGPADGKTASLHRLRVQPEADGAERHARPATIPRVMTAILFLGALLTLWRAGPGPSLNGAIGPGLSRGRSHWVAVALALACLWELLGLETWLDTRARVLVRAADLYYARALFQKPAISIAMAATVWLLISIRRFPHWRRLWLCSFATYVAIATVNLLSWHVIDLVAGLSWHGILLVQVLKLACAAATWYGIYREVNEPTDGAEVNYS